MGSLVHKFINEQVNGGTMVDLRINETLQTSAVGNRTYRVGLNAGRSETEPTGPDKSGSKPRGESVYLFLEFTIITYLIPPLLSAYPPRHLACHADFEGGRRGGTLP